MERGRKYGRSRLSLTPELLEREGLEAGGRLPEGLYVRAPMTAWQAEWGGCGGLNLPLATHEFTAVGNLGDITQARNLGQLSPGP